MIVTVKRILSLSVELSQPDFLRLTRIVQDLPEFALARDRYRLMANTLSGVERANVMLGRIDFDGTAMGVAVEVVRFLSGFGQVAPGKEALGVFLEQLLQNTGGGEDANFMSDLILRYQLNLLPLRTVETLPTPSPTERAAEHYIFISYARPDQAIAEQIAEYLRGSGFRVFRDTDDIHSGANWDTTIETALREADRMVLLLTQASMPYRKEVHREWFYFDQLRKDIHPLLLQDCTLHSRLFAYNYLDARSSLDETLAKLVAELAQ